MGEEEFFCVNHPRRATRVRCSSCGSPICTKCMRESPVGIKCPKCARQPFRVRFGKPRQYLIAGGGGLAAAGLIGAFWGIGIPGWFGILIPILAGAAVGEIVSRAAGLQTHPSFVAIAAVVTVAGLNLGAFLAGRPLGALTNPRWVLAVGIAAAVAVFRAGR